MQQSLDLHFQQDNVLHLYKLDKGYPLSEAEQATVDKWEEEAECSSGLDSDSDDSDDTFGLDRDRFFKSVDTTHSELFSYPSPEDHSKKASEQGCRMDNDIIAGL